MFHWNDSDLRVLLILGAVALFGMIVWLIKHKKIEATRIYLFLAPLIFCKKPISSTTLASHMEAAMHCTATSFCFGNK